MDASHNSGQNPATQDTSEGQISPAPKSQATLGEQQPLGLQSCPTDGQRIVRKYNITPQDYQSLTLGQLQHKYAMTDDDAQTLATSCNINFDWSKMSINQFLGK